MTIQKAENEALVEAVERLHGVREIEIEGGKALVVPSGLNVQSLMKFEDERREHPRRRTGLSVLTTLESFLEHVQRFKDAGSAIFAKDDAEKPSLLAVYDYHEPRIVEILPELEVDDDADPVARPGTARFGAHRASYAFPLSDEWKAWTELSKSGGIAQAALAEFLEDHLADVLAPEHVGDSIIDAAAVFGIELAGPTHLVDLSRNLSVKAESQVVQAQNPSTGEARIFFEERHQDPDSGGSVKIPGGFAIAIPVFRAGDLYQIAVRLRYRVSKGSVLFRIDPHRIERVFKHAFDEACVRARETTGLPVFYGNPEA